MALRIGHRGAAGHVLENTLGSIAKAIALEADFVELDLRATRDGHPVILHDARVDRTTDGTGDVSKMPLADVRRLKTRDGQRIPTLEDVLKIAEGRVGLVLEIKSEGLAESVRTVVERAGFRGPVIYASFLHAELLRLREVQPSALTMALLEGVPVRPAAFAADARVTHVGVGLGSLTGVYVDALHAAGLQVFAYTANDPLDIEWAKSCKVDGIISDYPERI